MTDIDIDFPDRTIPLAFIPHIPASKYDGVKFKKHVTGVYIQDIPFNPIDGLSTIDYKEAEDRGYFKIDFLNVHIYDGVRDSEHLNTLMNKEPLWELLYHKEFVDQLFHLNGHTDILRRTCPTSVEQLAAVLSMIRPAKRYLIGNDWPTIMTDVWKKPNNDDYFFKKSHAISYAIAVVVQMNLICESVS